MTDDVLPRIAVFDVETDPFPDRKRKSDKPEILAFCCEFLHGEKSYQWWGDDCLARAISFLRQYPEPCIIYVHNGGRFDFFLHDEMGACLMAEAGEKTKIINRRVAKIFIGEQEFRDSFLIMPEALATFKGKWKKKEIDYAKLRRKVRERHKTEILEYLHYDCLTLYENAYAFVEEFGPHLTIGSAAMKELRKRHEVETWDGRGWDGETDWDTRMRRFYYGGRTQCFKSGVIQGPYKIFDVNGMYQKVMRDELHPASVGYTVGNKIGPKTSFARIAARNYGALPVRTKDGVDFNVERGEFFATVHEIQAGEDTGTLKVERVIETIDFYERTKFAEFINHFTAQKERAQREGRLMHRANYKRVQNSAYGKWATNCAEFCDYTITHGAWLDEPWTLAERSGDWFIWERPARRKQWFNVATAASITGAARAILLRGLSNAIDPVYCDTDSIICRELRGVPIDEMELGAWKREGKKDKAGRMHYDADSIAIAGKKLYAVFDEEFCLKHACKGVKLAPEQIREIAEGGRVSFHNSAPSFKLGGGYDYVSRNVAATARPGLVPARGQLHKAR